MSKTSYKVAVIGAGDRGTAYSKSWQSLPNVELTAVCDIIEERYVRLKNEYGYKVGVKNYQEAIDREDVDIVTVCVPAAIHAKVATYALEHGKHVLTEKPMDLSLHEAVKLTRLAETSGLTLGLGFQYRNMVFYQKFRQAIAAGMVGRPLVARYADIRQIRSHKIAMHDIVDGNGGPVVDVLCHFADLMRWYFQADPVRVSASMHTFSKERPELAAINVKAPDTAVITIEFVSGDIGTLTICWGLPPGVNGPAEHSVLGPLGMITVEDGDVVVYQEQGKRGAIPGMEELKVPREDFSLATTEVARDFIEAIEQDRRPRTGGTEGEWALATSLAALKAAKEGRPVELKEIFLAKPKAADFA